MDAQMISVWFLFHSLFQSLPVDPVVIVRSSEELDLLEGDGAGEGAGDCWVEAQE